jgi:hypothetical protein
VARWDGTKKDGTKGNGDASDKLVHHLWNEYGDATGLKKDEAHITDNMRYYYGLNSRRGISPDTPGAIIEMGWLSDDGSFMTSEPGKSRMAEGIANAIMKFLKE